jgi:hypothetical protein
MNALSTPNDINKVFNYQIDKETYGVKERTNKVSSFFESENQG